MGFWAGSEKNQAATARAKAKTAQRKANRASNRASNRAANKASNGASNGAANKASKSAPAQQSFLNWLFNGSPKNQAATARAKAKTTQRKANKDVKSAPAPANANRKAKANRSAPQRGIPTQEQLAEVRANGGNLRTIIFGSEEAAEKAIADYRRKHPERVAEVERDFAREDHNSMWSSTARAAGRSDKPGMPKNKNPSIKNGARTPSSHLFNLDSFRRR